MTRTLPPTATETASGIFFDLANPLAEDVNMHDIELGLEREWRFSRQINKDPAWRTMPNVALHCVFVQYIMTMFFPIENNLMMLHALLHDAHEGYTGDISTPMKIVIGDDRVNRIADRIDVAIYEKLGLPLPNEREKIFIKKADRIALKIEASLYLPSKGSWCHDVVCDREDEMRKYLMDRLKMSTGSHWLVTVKHFLELYKNVSKKNIKQIA